ncbi:MAG: hypothetical protein M3O71_14565 [Bacteroidota bacterium]|nr:hypothetical protein [Bacteroidota bacterium]
MGTTLKPRAEKYEEKVKFDGTLEDLIKIAVKPIYGKNKNGGGRVSAGG